MSETIKTEIGLGDMDKLVYDKTINTDLKTIRETLRAYYDVLDELLIAHKTFDIGKVCRVGYKKMSARKMYNGLFKVEMDVPERLNIRFKAMSSLTRRINGREPSHIRYLREKKEKEAKIEE